jgi:hypothetical protein
VHVGDETFSVDLSNPQGATIADGSGTGTIKNDDCPNSLGIDLLRMIGQVISGAAFP